MKQQHHKRQKTVPPTHPSPSRGEGKGGGEKGFTLTELMIAIVIGMIIIGATYATYISQQRSFTAQDQVAEMNTTSKIALDMIANDIREAGFGVPKAGTFNVNTFQIAITATDSTTVPDSITLLGGFRDIATLQNAAVVGSNQIMVNYLPDTSTRFNLTDRRNISISGVTFAVITNCTLTADGTCSGAQAITLDRNINMASPAGIRVYLVEDTTYQVVGNQLQRVRRMNGGSPDTDVIAENIEDLQFALVDIAPVDGVTDRIRINILARTARPDLNFQAQGNPPATIENRNHATTNDSLRRRWWQMEVDLRNPI